MLIATVVLFLTWGFVTEGASTKITFPTSFPNPEKPKVDHLQVKNCYHEGLAAVESVAGLVQDLLLEETINFAAKNWVISPVSLAGVFAQLLMGSAGEIRRVLSEALSLEDDGEQKLLTHRQLGNLLRYLQHPIGDDYVLLLNSVVFLQSGFPLKTTYKHALMDFYDTQIHQVDFTGNSFGSLKKISEWVRNATLGRFSDITPATLTPNTVSLMTNVVYFKGSWELPFDPELTQPGTFFIDQNRKVVVDYMFGEQEVLYGNTSDFQLIGLPFKSREVVIYILLPNGKFSTRVAMKQLDAIASSAQLRNVTLVLPKFRIMTSISVKNSIAKYLFKPKPTQKWTSRNLTRMNELKKLPEKDMAKDEFDMSGASDDVRFRIDDILHKVSMQVDEQGLEIVAVTSTLVDHSGSNSVLKINRPFLFFVRHELTLTHLFWGLVSNPGKSSKGLGYASD